MKIYAIIPVWRRPEVTAITAKYLPVWVHPVYVLSEEDPEFEQNLKAIDAHEYCLFKNAPVSEKHNAGINYIRDREWDYMMTINSDGIINPSLIDIYNPFISCGADLFGINDLFVYDSVSKKSYYIDGYSDEICMGSGRMISREVVEKMDGYVYPSNENSGLDTLSRNRVIENGFTETVIKTDGSGYVLDIKSLCNINTFFMIKHQGHNLNEILNIEIIEKFGIRHEDKVFFNS